MSLDTATNFAKAALASGIASGAGTLTLVTGGGAKFATPPFNATLWNLTDSPDPSDDPDVEIVRVTLITGDVATITRAQEGTADSSHNTGGKTYALTAGPTAKLITDIESAVSALRPVILTSEGGSPTITGTRDGSNTTFTTSANSSLATLCIVYVDSLPDFGAVWSGTTLTPSSAPLLSVRLMYWS